MCVFVFSLCPNVCTWMFVHICPFDYMGALNLCPGGGVCVSARAGKSPLMGMTAVQGVVQLVVSESPEKHKSGMCKSVHAHPSSL